MILVFFNFFVHYKQRIERNVICQNENIEQSQIEYDN
jgi:hypothetical protein